MIDQNDEQLGIIDNAEAQRLAREAGLDLVEVAPNARPPVCRIMDYGKWKYSQKKHQKKHHEQQIKEVRLRPKTDDNDKRIKLNRAIRFFKKGHKVQFTMQFRGRERFHREYAMNIFSNIISEFGDRVKIERPPRMEGRHMTMVMAPVKNAFADVEDTADTGDDDQHDQHDQHDEVEQNEPVRPEPEQQPKAEE